MSTLFLFIAVATLVLGVRLLTQRCVPCRCGSIDGPQHPPRRGLNP